MQLIQVLTRYIKVVYSFAGKCGFLGALMLIILMLLTVGDVILRYFFNAPILGSYELTEFILVAMVFFAIPWATAKKANVRVDLFVGRLPLKVRSIFNIVTCFLSVFVTALFAWYTVPQAIYIWRLYTVSDMLEIPFYPFYFIVAFGFFVLFFVLVANLIEFIKDMVKGWVSN